MWRPALPGLVLLLAAATAAAGQDGLSVPLAHPRAPIAAVLDTTWECRGAGETLVPVAIDLHPAGSVWGLEARRHRVWWFAAPDAGVRFAGGGEGDAGSGFATRIFARSGLKVFTLDPWEARIDGYDLQGVRETRLDLAAALEVANQERIDAVDFCLSSSGELFVLDRTRGRVVQFDDDGRFLRVRADAEVTGARAPIAIEIDGRGRLFLLETRPPEIICLELDGRIEHRAIPTDGGAPLPVSLAVDAWGNAFVGDRRGGCVRVVPEGETPGWSITVPDHALQPTELATDGARLLVADASGKKIWVFVLDYVPRETVRPASETEP
jgi:hypothetical protein